MQDLNIANIQESANYAKALASHASNSDKDMNIFNQGVLLALTT